MESSDSSEPCDDGVQFPDTSEGGCHNTTLEEKRTECELCDVTIQVGSESFQAHRAILAAASPVFGEMFKSDLPESSKIEIPLECVDLQSLKNLIVFIYCNQLNITNANVFSLLETAIYLDITPAIYACFEFLSGTINQDNVLDIRAFAHLSDMKNIMENTDKYMRQNFEDFCRCERFSELTVDTLKSIICRDDLFVTTEEFVFEAVIRWVKALEKDRKDFLPELLKHVRMLLLSPNFLKFRVSGERLIETSPVCKGMLARLHEFPSLKRSPVLANFTIRERLSKEEHHTKCLRLAGCGLYAFCTDSGSTTLTFINYFDSINRKWAILCSNVCIDLKWLWHVVCTEENIYFIQMNNIFKLNLKTLDATNFEFNATVLSSTGIAYHCNRVYLFGGFDHMENKVYIFDLQNGKSTEIGSLVVERRYAATASLENFIFIIGGEHPSKSRLQSVEKFSPETRQSTNVSPMLKSRIGCSCAVVKGQIYVSGGELQTGLKLGSVGWSVEVYDPVTDQWSLIREISSRRNYASVIPCDGKLLALHEDPGTRDLRSETYDPETHEWKFDDPQFSDLLFCKVAVPTNSAIRFTDFDPSYNTFCGIDEDY